MKKLSNNNGVIKSSTLAGQRELLREYRNKINEIVESVTKLETREAQHELDVITSMQYLEKRIEELKKPVKPYTAMRSTGKTAIEVVEAIKKANKYCECTQPTKKDCTNCCYLCGRHPSPTEPQEDVRKQIIDLIKWHQFWKGNDILTENLADRILAIVKGV